MFISLSDTASPDDPNEITFAKGEILEILDKNGKWWQARKSDGTVGSESCLVFVHKTLADTGASQLHHPITFKSSETPLLPSSSYLVRNVMNIHDARLPPLWSSPRPYVADIPLALSLLSLALFTALRSIGFFLGLRPPCFLPSIQGNMPSVERGMSHSCYPYTVQLQYNDIPHGAATCQHPRRHVVTAKNNGDSLLLGAVATEWESWRSSYEYMYIRVNERGAKQT